MADIFTHVALARAGGCFTGRRFLAVLMLGSILPDLLYKAGLYLTGGSTWFCEPTHSPLFLVIASWTIALLFEPAFRKRAFAALWMGSWSHILIDLGKNYAGEGTIMWAFPFSMDRIELGWYDPNETIYFILPALCLAVIAEWLARFRSRSR